MAVTALTKLLVCVGFALSASTAIGSDGTCMSGDACDNDTPKQQDISVLFQSKNPHVLTARVLPKAHQNMASMQPTKQKLMGINATVDYMKVHCRNFGGKKQCTRNEMCTWSNVGRRCKVALDCSDRDTNKTCGEAGCIWLKGPKRCKASVQPAWDNHFSAFGAQDVRKILKDYNDDSVVSVYNQADGKFEVFNGLDAVERLFTSLFHSLFDLSDLSADYTIQDPSGSEPGSVFLTWSCNASGYAEATDTFVFDSNGKIASQNVVVWYEDQMHVNSPVHSAWRNHLAAFINQDVAKIKEDYTNDSTITVFNSVTNETNSGTGLAWVETVFTGLFLSLSDTSDLRAPVQVVKRATTMPGEVFLIWSCAASGYKSATDTFIFDNKGKIQRQNVVVHFENPVGVVVPVSPPALLVAGAKVGSACSDRLNKASCRSAGCKWSKEQESCNSPVQHAWDNHFSAFATQDVTKILKDYNYVSVVNVYNQADDKLEVFKGLDEIEKLFTSLFNSLFDLSDLAAQYEVQDSSSSEPGSVFLTWSCSASGYAEATDTFVFDSNGKITSQNVVVLYVDPNPVNSPVHSAWQNHLAAFDSKDVEKIKEDYTDDSTITVFNSVTKETNSGTGLDWVHTVFVDLFGSLSNTDDFGAPVQVVKQATDDRHGEVFLIWSCAASGYKFATDTFIFDNNGKIQRQNVVVHFEADPLGAER